VARQFRVLRKRAMQAWVQLALGLDGLGVGRPLFRAWARIRLASGWSSHRLIWEVHKGGSARLSEARTLLCRKAWGAACCMTEPGPVTE